MIRFLSPLVSAILLAAPGAPGAAQTAALAGPAQVIPSFRDVHCDTPVCNCSSAPVMQELCHDSSFDIEVGGELVKVKTGFSSSDCLTVTVLPDKCVQICYVYRVFQRCSWWWGCTYHTVLLRTTVVESPAGCAPATPAPTAAGSGLTGRPLAG